MVSFIKPKWIRRRAPDQASLAKMKELLDGLQLHTVCESAHCPNQGECFGRGVATFMILGDVCTRNCTFCAVTHGPPAPPDVNEPQRVAEAAQRLGLQHVVITSVTRDDLPDGGAEYFAKTIHGLRKILPDATVEVLVPDFRGSAEAIEVVVMAKPAVFNHNLETVPRLYPKVRPKADYHVSLQILNRAKEFDSTVITKSGLMLGLGESHEEVLETMRNLCHVNCNILTLGQYLCPSPNHFPVVRFLDPSEFDELRIRGIEMGFQSVVSGPLVRSSYRAEDVVRGDSSQLKGSSCSMG